MVEVGCTAVNVRFPVSHLHAPPEKENRLITVAAIKTEMAAFDGLSRLCSGMLASELVHVFEVMVWFIWKAAQDSARSCGRLYLGSTIV